MNKENIKPTGDLLPAAKPFLIGSLSREITLQKAEDEYNQGHESSSIYYQMLSLYQAMQERYYKIDPALVADNSAAKKARSSTELKKQMNNYEKKHLKASSLLQFGLTCVSERPEPRPQKLKTPFSLTSCNFLKNTTEPQDGIRKVAEVCSRLPREWTILQLCKGYQPDNTYRIFPMIQETYAPIFLTILRHARSDKYPMPICIRFHNEEQKSIYKKFRFIAERFKQTVMVNPADWKETDSKDIYWHIMNELNEWLAGTIGDLIGFFYPWNFLFTGIPYNNKANEAFRQTAFAAVDEFCDSYQWPVRPRVLLSLAALHVVALSETEIQAIGNSLAKNQREAVAAVKMLKKLQSRALMTTPQEERRPCFPCLLVVDERLDHFPWEEINTNQEFCRVNSLQCLWRLYLGHKQQIRRGYLALNIDYGSCVLNPDGNLPKMETRLRTFFTHWLPHWYMKSGVRLSSEELYNKMFKSPCYVYSGHGSGLQFVSGHSIAREVCKAVVFLFGCDSTRSLSSGLYSEMSGTHLYYHAAMCPTLVGLTMPCLDSNVDTICSKVLSSFLIPNSTDILPWSEVDLPQWLKDGTIAKRQDGQDADKGCKASSSVLASKTTPAACKRQMKPRITAESNTASLCSVLMAIHQRKYDPRFYNTVPYVCRGLPVWNLSVSELPN